MLSKVGREMLADVIGSHAEEASDKCCRFTYQHPETLKRRALARGEPGFDIDRIIDGVVAPVMFHILFSDRDVSVEYGSSLIQRAFYISAEQRVGRLR